MTRPEYIKKIADRLDIYYIDKFIDVVAENTNLSAAAYLNFKEQAKAVGVNGIWEWLIACPDSVASVEDIENMVFKACNDNVPYAVADINDALDNGLLYYCGFEDAEDKAYKVTNIISHLPYKTCYVEDKVTFEYEDENGNIIRKEDKIAHFSVLLKDVCCPICGGKLYKDLIGLNGDYICCNCEHYFDDDEIQDSINKTKTITINDAEKVLRRMITNGDFDGINTEDIDYPSKAMENYLILLVRSYFEDNDIRSPKINNTVLK